MKPFLNPNSQGTKITRGVDINPKVPCYIVKKNLFLLRLSSLDFSFIVEENISEIFKELHQNKIKVEGVSGAGAVKVVVKGNHQIVSIYIDEEASKGNKKILEDYIVAACNDAMNKLEKETKEKMGSVMNLPGGMKLPF